jgi:4-amino-4-deoxy-L-arabinose transferase-like glycosyltransferase
MTDALFTCLATWGLYWLMRAWIENSQRLLAFGIATCGLAAAFRYQGVLLAVIVLVTTIIVAIQTRRLPWRGAWFAGFRGLSPVSSLYARALRVGAWLGVPPRVSLTPHEYADRVGRAIPSAQGPARLVADLYTQERYAGRQPDGDDVHAARDAWRDLRGIAIGTLLRRNRGGSRQ